MSNKRFPICLKTEDIRNQIENVFKNFISCRNGDDLQDPFIKMLKICQKNKQNNFKSLIQKEKFTNNKTNPYYSINKVPGS